MTEILVRTGPGTIEVAVAAEGRMHDYRLDCPDRPDGVGDLYHARIGAILPALGGAFVVLGDAPDGFLPDRDMVAAAVEGASIAVRVVRSAMGGKGPRVTARLDEATRADCLDAPPGLVRRGTDALALAAAAWPEAKIHVDDIHHAARARTIWAERVVHDRSPRAAWLDTAIGRLSAPVIALPGGLVASITPTPALVAIDLDTGASSGARAAKATAQFAANRDALPALLHEIRLRDLSGAIVIDLAGMAQRKRPALAPLIAESLARDPLAPRFVGFSGLGFAEIQRPRVRPPLHELHALPIWAISTALRSWLADPQHTRLVLSPNLAAELDHAPVARGDAERLCGLHIEAAVDPALPPLQWRLDSRKSIR